MNILKKALPIFKRNTFIIVSTFIVMLITVRVLLPSVLLKDLNTFLSLYSPEYRFHVKDVDISIMRASYRLEGVEGYLRKDHAKFLTFDKIEASLAFRDLFKGKVLMDVVATAIDFHFVKINDLEVAKKKIFPLTIGRLLIKNSRVFFKELYFSNIEAKVTIISSGNINKFSSFEVKATLQDSSPFTGHGHLNLTTTPVEWELKSEIQGLDMTKLKFPVIISRGKLDYSADAVSIGGKIQGQVKNLAFRIPFSYDHNLTFGKKITGVP